MRRVSLTTLTIIISYFFITFIQRDIENAGAQEKIKSCIVPYDGLEINEDTILCEGTYNIPDQNEDGVIKIVNSRVTLDCNGASLIGDGIGTAITASCAGYVTIKNCKLERYGRGIALYNVINSNIYGNRIFYYSDRGIYDFGGHSNSIRNNLIQYAGSDNVYAAIEVAFSKDSIVQSNSILDTFDSPNGYQILIWMSDYSKVYNNVILNYSRDDSETIANGIVIDGCYGCEIKYNTINTEFTAASINLDALSYGIQECEVAYNVIVGKKISGIWLFNGPKYSRVYNNIIAHSLGGYLAGNFAFGCWGGDSGACENVFIYNNFVQACGVCISLEHDVENLFVYGNTFQECDKAFNFADSSDLRESIFYNNIFDVKSVGEIKGSIRDVEFNTLKDCSKPNILGGDCIGGNYWGNLYQGEDVDGDGIGEEPFLIDSNLDLYDKLPLVMGSDGDEGEKRYTYVDSLLGSSKENGKEDHICCGW